MIIGTTVFSCKRYILIAKGRNLREMHEFSSSNTQWGLVGGGVIYEGGKQQSRFERYLSQGPKLQQ